MASIQNEYHRFLTSLQNKELHEDVYRMANLVFHNFRQLAEVGTARRARSRRLTPIAVQGLTTTPLDLPVLEGTAPPTQPLGRLHELQVGPFRGFMSPEVFDLSKPITLVYGANGTGKSSFCEALETVFLGSISEAYR